jgi:hypothetical protein
LTVRADISPSEYETRAINLSELGLRSRRLRLRPESGIFLLGFEALSNGRCSMARKTIRLACMVCDRADFDGITQAELRKAIRAGWKHVERQQTYRQACKTYSSTDKAPRGYSVLEWWTHLGYCPNCAVE